MPHSLGKILLIANPAAQNGHGEEAANRALKLLQARLGQEAVIVARTTGPRHACAIAERAIGFNTIIALGGDGVIHEAANGLMRRPINERPAFGIIPVGSGNDYARTLGIPADVKKAVEILLSVEEPASNSVKPVQALVPDKKIEILPTDVGCVNGEFFVETLSFGLDAAIALDTMERRVRTGRTGTILYAEAGIAQLTHHLDSRTYVAHYDDDAPQQAQSITFAVQVGPYYGGGFRICPDARVDDGLLDVCIAHPPAGIAKALYIFARAKNGSHTSFKQVELRQCATMHVEFNETPPAQIDGERIKATSFDISIQPAALRVIRPV